MTFEPESFKTEYKKFLEIISGIAYFQKKYMVAIQQELALEFENSVLLPLKSDDAIGAVVYAMVIEEDARVQDALMDELLFFNGLYEDFVPSVDGSPECQKPSKDVLHLAAEKAHVVKTSFSTVLNLPGWLQKLLHILNELLKLFKPV